MERVAVLGTGVIGGSIGLKLVDLGVRVSAFDTDPVAARAAESAGIEVYPDPVAAVDGVDVAVIAVPVDAAISLVRELARTDCPVVTDVGSTKAGIVEAAGQELGDRFVGGHPMAGSERHGFAAAMPDLFEDAPWILTPTETTGGAAYRSVAALVARLGARVVALSPEGHDALLARLSHLPQLVASSLVHVAAGAGDEEALLGLAAGGFRDVTRIAASDPGMWIPILKANREGVLDALDGLSERLELVHRLVRDGSWEELRGFLADARGARLERFVRPDHSAEPVTLVLLVPDRPGVLAEVTTAAGNMGANIEDLKIFHSTEGGRGRLELVITGSPAADALTRTLEGLGYHVERGVPE